MSEAVESLRCHIHKRSQENEIRARFERDSVRFSRAKCTNSVVTARFGSKRIDALSDQKQATAAGAQWVRDGADLSALVASRRAFISLLNP